MTTDPVPRLSTQSITPWLRRNPTKQMAKCPNREQHSEGPDGYLEWHHWAEVVHKTHTFAKCPGCDLWLIATRKPVSDTGEPHA